MLNSAKSIFPTTVRDESDTGLDATLDTLNIVDKPTSELVEQSKEKFGKSNLSPDNNKFMNIIETSMNKSIEDDSKNDNKI